MYRILTINPGSTSTKIALFEDELCVFSLNMRHRHEDLAAFPRLVDQAPWRRELILSALVEKGFEPRTLSALAVRGGLLRPLDGGVYLVDDEMVGDLVACRYGVHASNLGGIIALPLARELGIPVFTVDPVTVDEFDEVARFSGLAGIKRQSMSHALNMKAVGRLVAKEIGMPYDEINLVIAHLGSGISVSAHRCGRMVDVNNANNEGPFSLERSGTLPALALVSLCYRGGYSEGEMVELLTSRGGIFSYLGTKDFAEVMSRVAAGNLLAAQVVEAMAYQVAKEIGAMAAVLNGKVDRVVITGGMANSKPLTEMIANKVSFLAPVVVVPGEEEMSALALGALRVLRGQEEIQLYRAAGDKRRWGCEL